MLIVIYLAYLVHTNTDANTDLSCWSGSYKYWCWYWSILLIWFIQTLKLILIYLAYLVHANIDVDTDLSCLSGFRTRSITNISASMGSFPFFLFTPLDCDSSTKTLLRFAFFIWAYSNSAYPPTYRISS
jgi:hypothetical protein